MPRPLTLAAAALGLVVGACENRAPRGSGGVTADASTVIGRAALSPTPAVAARASTAAASATITPAAADEARRAALDAYSSAIQRGAGLEEMARSAVAVAIQYPYRAAPYTGATESDALTIALDVRSIRSSKVGPGTYVNDRDPRAKRYEALILPLHVSNRGHSPVTFKASHEWYGGVWPETDLLACVRRLPPPTQVDAGAGEVQCQSVYVALEQEEVTATTTLTPGAAQSFPLRMDWSGTRSMPGLTLMAPHESALYEIRIVVFFRQDGRWAYEIGPSARIAVEAGLIPR